MEVDILLNVLAIVLFLGFGTIDVIAFTALDRQKEIQIPSRYGRQTGPLDILYVNGALLLVALMLYTHSYRFLPALVTFVLMIMLNSRMCSGISPRGVFIGTTCIDWSRIEAYRIINDEISTVQVRVYANGKQYVLRCDKEQRQEINACFGEHGIEVRSQKESDDKGEQ